MAEGTQDVPQGGEIHRRLIEAMSDISGVHEGRRTVHAKGTWARGTFTATPEAAKLCAAPQLNGEPGEALIRFSKASGKPDAHDASRDGGGFAVKLKADAEEWDIIAVGPPVFVARTVEDFLELLRARKPDPETGRPDMERVGGYLARHPEAQLAIQSSLGADPPASLVSVPYFSPHAFALEAAGGTRTWVRWSWRPTAEERISDDEARERGRNYLSEELAERLASGPATMELRFQLAAAEDSLTDPTELWPDERESVVAGTLEIAELIDDPERDGHIEVFDPMRLPTAISPSDDEILHARPRAYSVSAHRRWGR